MGTADADPAVVEHVRSCDSCWLDWQIQQGARYLENPAVKDASGVNDRVVARVLIRSRRHSEAPTRWRDAAEFAALVAVAVFAFMLAVPASSGATPIVPAAAYSVAAGVAAMFYVKKRDGDRVAAQAVSVAEDAGGG